MWTYLNVWCVGNKQCDVSLAFSCLLEVFYSLYVLDFSFISPCLFLVSAVPTASFQWLGFKLSIIFFCSLPQEIFLCLLPLTFSLVFWIILKLNVLGFFKKSFLPLTFFVSSFTFVLLYMCVLCIFYLVLLFLVSLPQILSFFLLLILAFFYTV